MHVELLVSVLKSISCLEGARLIIRAVRARDEFSEGVVAREPGLKIVLHSSCVVKFTRHDIDHLVGQTKTLVECLRSTDHAIKFVPGFAWVAVNELLNLFKLMYTENTPYISAVRASFLTEASGHASVPVG